MKQAIFFAAAAILFTSCGNQQSAEKTNQVRLDSMSQVLTRQHIIDSMNAVNP